MMEEVDCDLYIGNFFWRDGILFIDVVVGGVVQDFVNEFVG